MESAYRKYDRGYKIVKCNYFSKCASCNNFQGTYKETLTRKLSKIKEDFKKLYNGYIEVFPSKEIHFRNRAEFRVYHDENGISYAMNDFEKKILPIKECLIVNKYIYDIMPKLLDEIVKNNIEEKLFGVDFLSSSRGELTVSLIYHKKLDALWEEKAKNIAQRLCISIIGRSKKQKVVIGKDYITENILKYRYKIIENSFSQPNSFINSKMIQWVVNDDLSHKNDLLELYCGAGNFTIPFATKYNKILATEISKNSIKAAKENMLINNVKNIEFLRMSVEEFVDALNGGRVYNRMKHIDINDYSIDTVFVDPPRAGLDQLTTDFIKNYENIIYISCNPETLKRDLESLCNTHNIVSMAVFDQFAYTNHLEMGVKLRTKNE